MTLLATTLDCSVTQTLATFPPWSMTLLARDEAVTGARRIAEIRKS